MVQQMVDPATSDVTDVNTSYDAGVGAPAAAGTPADKFKIHSDPSQGPAPAASAITVTTADPAASTDDPGPEPPGPWSDAIGDFFAGDDDDDANLTPCACHFTPTSPAGVESLEPDTPFAAVDHQTSAGLLQQCEAAEVIRGPMSLRMPGVTQSRADMDYYMYEKTLAQRCQQVLDYIVSQASLQSTHSESRSESRSSGVFEPAEQCESGETLT